MEAAAYHKCCWCEATKEVKAFRDLFIFVNCMKMSEQNMEKMLFNFLVFKDFY